MNQNHRVRNVSIDKILEIKKKITQEIKHCTKYIKATRFRNKSIKLEIKI